MVSVVWGERIGSHRWVPHRIPSRLHPRPKRNVSPVKSTTGPHPLSISGIRSKSLPRPSSGLKIGCVGTSIHRSDERCLSPEPVQNCLAMGQKAVDPTHPRVDVYPDLGCLLSRLRRNLWARTGLVLVVVGRRRSSIPLRHPDCWYRVGYPRAGSRPNQAYSSNCRRRLSIPVLIQKVLEARLRQLPRRSC